MRKLIVSNLISLDGYASGPGGDVMALPFDTTFATTTRAHAGRRHPGVRRHDYRGFLSYWPPVADDPAQPEVERAISRHREPRTPRGLRHPDRRGDRPVAAEHEDRTQGRGTQRHRPNQEGRGRPARGLRQHDDVQRPARRRSDRRAASRSALGVWPTASRPSVRPPGPDAAERRAAARAIPTSRCCSTR